MGIVQQVRLITVMHTGTQSMKSLLDGAGYRMHKAFAKAGAIGRVTMPKAEERFCVYQHPFNPTKSRDEPYWWESYDGPIITTSRDIAALEQSWMERYGDLIGSGWTVPLEDQLAVWEEHIRPNALAVVPIDEPGKRSAVLKDLQEALGMPWFPEKFPHIHNRSAR